jgi:pyruvate dehydrogenase E1 component
MNKITNSIDDLDPEETQEWLNALNDVIKYTGKDRAQFLLKQLMSKAQQKGVAYAAGLNTPYLNTIAPENEIKMPPDKGMLLKLTNIMRWNAIVTVLKTVKKYPEVGTFIQFCFYSYFIRSRIATFFPCSQWRTQW